MTLDQYLGTVAWLFIAALMFHAIANAKYVMLHDTDIFRLYRKIGRKYTIETDNFMLFYAVFLPSGFYTACGAILFLPALLT